MGARTLSRRHLIASSCVWAAAPAAKLRVLIIDGINNHDWQAGTRAILSILADSGRFEATVSTTPPVGAPPAAWDGWRPSFTGVDVVINNFNGGHKPDGIRWPSRVEQSLTRYLEQGGGLVNFHAANNAFLEWADYNEMIGLGWRDQSFGPGLILDEQERVVVVPAGEGPGPGHGPRHEFEVTTLDRRHAITEGMPKRWLHPSEQLTHGQHGVRQPRHGALDKELQILTYAYSKDSLRREPMDWIRRWDRGRIYTTMLGHTWKNEPNPNLDDPVFRRLFARGVEWAASGQVSGAASPRG